MTGRLGMAVPQRSADPCHELAGAEWLRDIIVRAQIQSGDLLLLLGAGRYDDHRNIAPGTQLLLFLYPVNVRKPYIYQDLIGAEIISETQSLSAV